MLTLTLQMKGSEINKNKNSKLANASHYLQLLFFILTPSEIPAGSDEYILDLAPSPPISIEVNQPPDGIWNLGEIEYERRKKEVIYLVT